MELKIPVEKVKAGLAVAGGPTASDPGGGDAPDHGEVAGGDSIKRPLRGDILFYTDTSPDKGYYAETG